MHGDLANTLRVLRLGGIVDHRGRWSGKRSILGTLYSLRLSRAVSCRYTVQTGDIVDRGKDTIAVYALMDQLRAQAEKAGGAVVSLLGNHEMMNAFGDWFVFSSA